MDHLSPSATRHDAIQWRQLFHVVIGRGENAVSPGATVADLLRPEFWLHQSRLKPGDVVDVVAEDGSFDLTLRVVARDATAVHMRVLRRWEADSVKELPANSPFEVNHTPKTHWRVMRKSDGAELKRDFVDKAGAIAWALDTMRVAA